MLRFALVTAGMGIVTTASLAAPLTFTSIVHTDGSANPPINLTAFSQVSLGVDQQAAVIGMFDSQPGVSFTKVTSGGYGHASTQIIARGDANDTIWSGNVDGATPVIEPTGTPFRDVSVSTSRVTFLAQAAPPVLGFDRNYAILQYDPDTNNTPAGTKHRVVFEGDNHVPGADTGDAFSLNSGNTIVPDYQVNAAGRAAFGGTVANSDRIVTRSGPDDVYLVNNSTTNFNATQTVPAKIAITSDDDAVFIATNGGSREVVQRGPSAPQTRLSASDITAVIGSVGYHPSLLLGASPADTLTLVAKDTDSDTVDDNESLFVVHNSTVTELTTSRYDLTGGRRALGQVSENGKVSYFAPSSSGHVWESVEYFDASDSTSAQIATLGASPLTGFDFIEFGLKASPLINGPSVNDSGTVVFEAVLDDTNDNTNDTFNSLWYWSALTGELTLIAREGDTPVTTIDGTTYGPGNPNGELTISTLLFQDIETTHWDILRDGLSEDNFFAFGLTYTVNSGAFQYGVFVTPLPTPEPTSAMLAAPAALLLRRRRRGIGPF